MYGRRNHTPEQIAEMLPGYEPMEGGNGYYFKSPTGRVMITGGMQSDQIFSQERLGHINVSRAWEFLDKAGIKPHIVGLDDGIKQNIAQVEINPEHVRKISSAQLKQPVLMAVASDGVQVLDGHHRLVRLIWDRKTSFPALLLPPDGLEHFQVRTWRDAGNGKWQLIAGASFDEVAVEVRRAKQRWTPQNIIRTRL